MISKKELFLSKTHKIYKDNRLNKANFGDFKHNDYQVFLNLVSKIGGVDFHGKYIQPDKLQREHILTAKEFSELFNVSLSNCYNILKNAVDRLMKADVRIEKTNNSFFRVNVCSSAEYNKREGRIIIKFTDDIMPYLAQVKQKFVLYNLKEVSNFGSLYTTRLYELIQEFKETGWVLKSIDQLRENFAVGSKFKTYNNFKQKTFSHACKEINNNYDINLRFEEIKEGRKVVAVKFFFKKTIVKKVINEKTGKITNFYSKPRLVKNAKKKINKTDLSNSQDKNILEGQMSFDEKKQELKPIGGILSSIMSKIKLRSKK